MKRLNLVIAVILTITFLNCSCSNTAKNQSQMKTKTSDNPVALYGVCYGPFSGIQNPACGPYPTLQQLKNDLATLAKYNIRRIRIYSTVGIQSQIPQIAHEAKIECIAGCWIGKESFCNEREIEALIQTAKKGFLKALVVGNEVLLRQDISEQKLIEYIKRVKKETNLPVGYADVWTEWLKHPNLAKEVDFILVHIYAYWAGISIEKAAAHTIEKFEEMKKTFPNKEIIIGELGWPKAGPPNKMAVPSIENQKRFIQEFTTLADKYHIPYYYFEAFDEDWKALQEGGVGNHWGIYFLHRKADFTPPLVDKFPFVVYKEISLVSNFIPSGWMGDYSRLKFNPAYTKNPHSGKYCIRIDYQGRFPILGWAGIYWQYPENNWGELPGYRFKGVKQLTFWARGERGGEKCEFKVGGINTGKYKDSLPLLTTRYITLSKEWKKYTIPIPYKNLDCVISGFCWVTNSFYAKAGMTIYLDDIQFE